MHFAFELLDEGLINGCCHDVLPQCWLLMGKRRSQGFSRFLEIGPVWAEPGSYGRQPWLRVVRKNKNARMRHCNARNSGVDKVILGLISSDVKHIFKKSSFLKLFL